MHRRATGNSLDEKSDELAPITPPAPLPAATIAAISTPAGEGAIALIRMSGAEAVAIADRIFRGKQKPSEFPSYVQRLGEIVDTDERIVDQVMLSVHHAPFTYTGENLVEISGHGGTLVSARVLEACLRAGARAAEPGEFTERAFRNGKMDLTQAEAVFDLIRATTDLALRSATEQLEGRLGEKIRGIRDELISLLAHIDASIDFPEEGIAPDDGGKLRSRFDSVRAKIEALLATAEEGRILREGVRVVIYGATNAGKSSLLNRLLGYDRAIVSEQSGTTRDTIEEAINLRGVPIRLFDTAGLRPSSDEIERAGMARTEKSRGLADLLLHVGDGSAPAPAEFSTKLEEENVLLVLNKNDLPEHSDWANSDAMRISCVTGNGLDELKKEILARISQKNLRAENSVAINTRHCECLRRGLDKIERACAEFDQGTSRDFLAVDVHGALAAIGEIIGEVGVEEVLNSVFRQFCIGK